MAKKISIGATVAITLLGCLVTFQATYITLYNRYERKYSADSIQAVTDSLYQNNGTGGGDSSQMQSESDEFLNRAMNKLAEVDYLYRNYYIGEMDDEHLLDMITAGYVVGTGDEYANCLVLYVSKAGFLYRQLCKVKSLF